MGMDGGKIDWLGSSLTLAGPGKSSGELVARQDSSLQQLRMFRLKPKDLHHRRQHHNFHHH